jgi:hypothetical protein
VLRFGDLSVYGAMRDSDVLSGFERRSHQGVTNHSIDQHDDDRGLFALHHGWFDAYVIARHVDSSHFWHRDRTLRARLHDVEGYCLQGGTSGFRDQD